MTAEIKNEFQSKLLGVLFSEEMKKHTSFKIGGPADIFVECESADDVIVAIDICKKESVPYMILGNGSNLLVSDDGIEGAVIHIGSKMSAIAITGETVVCESGCLLSTLANAVQRESLSGLEFAAGIPGSLGGGVYMNAGAYGGELRDVIESVRYIDSSGNVKTAEKDELDFSYRHSMFSGKDYVILSVTMKLKKGNPDEIRAEMTELNKRRCEKQPLEFPSAGSTFKRPEGYFAGKLIQDAGLMGYSVGGAQVSEKHAGFVINTGNATAEDVLNLIEHIKKTVFEKFEVTLEPEVRITGRQ